MFHRLSYAEWQSLIPIIAFCITFGGFLVFSIRACFMRQDKVQRLATLPLETPHSSSTPKDHTPHA